MLCKNGKRPQEFLVVFIFIVAQCSLFGGAFNKAVNPLAFAGYEAIIAWLALRTIYHLISTAHSWNNC